MQEEFTLFFKNRMRNLNFESLKRKIHFRDVYLWGADRKGKWFAEIFAQNGIEICGFLDRAAGENKKEGVRHPEEVIKKENKKTSFIIITMMLKHQKEVCDFLKENDFIEMEDYYYPYKDWDFAFHDITKREWIKKGELFITGKHLADTLDPCDLYFLLWGGHIGDEALALSWLYAFKENHFIRRITIITSQPYAQLAELYAEDIDEIWVWEKEPLEALRIYSMSNDREHYNILGANWIWFPREYKIPFPMNQIIYKTMHLGLPYDTKSKYFQISKGAAFEEFIACNRIRQRKSVLLIPHAKSVRTLPQKVWKLLAMKLSTDYTVYTNVNKEEKAVSGTIPLDIPLKLIAPIVDYMGCAISARCGIADVLALGKCEGTYVVYWNVNEQEENYSKTNQLYVNGKESILYKNAIMIPNEFDEDFITDMIVERIKTPVESTGCL